MKAKFFALMALVLGLAACQNDPEGLNVNADGTVNTTLSVALPDAVTRAATADSAKGGLSNVDLGEYDIRYILEVYNDEGELVKERATKVSDDATVVFDLRLIPNRNYNFVVWADFVTDGNDLYYNTAAGLRDVTVVEDEWTAMTEARDAYTGVKRIEGYNSQSTINLTLTRPFGKLRVVTTDIAELYNILPKDMKIEYRNGAYTGFDAFAAKAQGTEVAKTFEYTLPEVYNDYADDANRTLFADYLFGTEDGTMQFDMYVKYDDGVESTTVVNFNTAIPVERNKLTTVKGNLLTDDNDFTVTIDDNFGGFYTEGGDEATQETIEEQLKANKETIEVTLTEDVMLSFGSTSGITLGGSDTKSITINGAAFTRSNEDTRPVLTLTSKYRYNFMTVNPNAKLYLNDIVVNVIDENSANTWDSDDITFNVDVTANNVLFNRAIAVEHGHSVDFKDVVINEARTDKDFYAFWITAEGSVVNLDDCAISGNRGIKIDNEYVANNNIAKVTLNVKNTKFNTAKKAAIHVKSPAGADINLENVNLENVAADPINAVWVDEEAEQYADLVTVTGGTKVVEGSPASDVTLVKTSEELLAAVANAKDGATIALADGSYEGFIYVSGKSLNIYAVNNGKATINGKIGIVASNKTINIEGIVFENSYTGSVTANHQYLDKTGRYCIGLYDAYVNVKDCTFNLSQDGGINFYAFNYPQFCTVKNCTFNCNGFRPINSKVNVEIDGCTFVDQYRYSVQIYGNKNNGNEIVKFTNNTIINPSATSKKPYAASVQISNSYSLSNVAFTIEGNTLEQTYIFTDLKFAYDYLQNGANLVEMNTCTLNGEAIVDAQCVVIPDDPKVKEVLFGMLVPEIKDEAYVITNAKELFWFANEVNANGNNFSGKTVKLGADIDLENAEWTPVGQTGATQFMGTFDGQNYTISNLNVDKTSETGEYYSSGLFGWLNAATVKNVKVNGATVKGNHNVGVIAGYLETAGCTIENCYVVGAAVECHHANDYACGDKAGVIVGHAGNSGVAVKNCTATDSTLSAGRDAGQIVGAAKEANVTGCSATNVKVTANGECTGANVRNEVIGRLL